MREDAGTPLAVIRGRFESGGPIRNCGDVVTGDAPDGQLIRPRMDVCGDDMDALAGTIVANLNAVGAQGGRALVVIAQGINLPDSWLAECETFMLNDRRFTGEVCVPWDDNYQARLRAALVDTIGPAVAGHPALAGVYFTTTTMTNGAEMHFRVERSTFPYPGDDVFTGAYLDVMDIYQEAFDVPILFEAGHCIWDIPGSPSEMVDCHTPLELYHHTRDTYGSDHVGVALWNCAERFWATPTSEGSNVLPLLLEADADGVSIGCQTVGNFTRQPCRFSSDEVADYGTADAAGDCQPSSETFDPEAACVDTMNWFAGTSRVAPDSPVIHGTWAENWDVEYAPGGVYDTSEACRAAIDQLAP